MFKKLLQFNNLKGKEFHLSNVKVPKCFNSWIKATPPEYLALITPHTEVEVGCGIQQGNLSWPALHHSMATQWGWGYQSWAQQGFPQSKLKPLRAQHKGAAILVVRCQPISGQDGKQLSAHMVSGHHVWGKPCLVGVVNVREDLGGYTDFKWSSSVQDERAQSWWVLCTSYIMLKKVVSW